MNRISVITQLPVMHLLPASLLLALAANVALGLPEDADQPIEISWDRTELLLEEGLSIFHGTSQEPTCITQGTMQICGIEIRIKQEGDMVTLVTTTGEPAHFQQQLEAGEEPLHASGRTLIYDNNQQLLSVETDAELIYGGIRSSAHRFEYDLQARRLIATRSPDGEPARMVIPPPNRQ
jgi:lipopolysaccharide export system protein LptA